ncbi:MAG TPA: DUF2953 domain-containing protein [Peptococcaceae bacterium]|nr:DUF2953 domain-containing protein [Peptococcaceae bacterium]
MKLLALALVIICWLFLVFLLSIYLKINYCYQASGSKLSVQLKVLFSHLKIELDIPQDMLANGIKNALSNVVEDFTENFEGDERPETVIHQDRGGGKKVRRYKFLKNSLRELLKHYVFSWARFIWVSRQLMRLKRYFYKKVKLHSFQAVVEIGGKDACTTGLLTGVCWAFFGQMTARLHRTVTVSRNEISYNVIPHFNEATFLCRLNCILSLKICHIIFTAYKFLLFIIKNRRIRNYARASD